MNLQIKIAQGTASPGISNGCKAFRGYHIWSDTSAYYGRLLYRDPGYVRAAQWGTATKTEPHGALRLGKHLRDV